MTTSTTTLPFLDLLDPGFDPAGPPVRAAREEHWCARTPVGLAVLRHAPLSALLSDRRLVQGTHHVLASQGLADGPLVEWMNTIILTVEGGTTCACAGSTTRRSPHAQSRRCGR
jgi:hypothetical protein